MGLRHAKRDTIQNPPSPIKKVVKKSNLPIQQPFQYPLQIADDPLLQQNAQAMQQHGQNIQQQRLMLEQFMRNIQQLLQQQAQDAGHSVPRSPQDRPVSSHHIYHPPLPWSQSQTRQLVTQSQFPPTTATTGIQAGSNSPQISHSPDKTTSEGGKQPDEVPSSAAGSHVLDCFGNANRSWAESIQFYSSFGPLIASIKNMFLEHPGHKMILHDIPISMDDLDDFCHRYTAHTFRLLGFVAPRHFRGKEGQES